MSKPGFAELGWSSLSGSNLNFSFKFVIAFSFQFNRRLTPKVRMHASLYLLKMSGTWFVCYICITTIIIIMLTEQIQRQQRKIIIE